MATTEQAQSTQPGSAADEVRRVVSERGIQFLFAQFVDMHGKPSAKLVPAHALDTLEQPCYDMRALTRNLDFVSVVSEAVTSLGWDNYATDHEDANGQFEQNFQFDDALVTSDRAIFFRYMVESLAQERG